MMSDLVYSESYSASDSLSLEDMIASDMREEHHIDGHLQDDVAAAVISFQQTNNNWLSHSQACDASIDFDTSGLLVNPKTGTPVIISGGESVAAAGPVSSYCVDMDVSKGDSTFTSLSSSSSSSSDYSSSSSSSSSSSEDEMEEEEPVNDLLFDGSEIEHVPQQTSLISTDKYYPKPVYSYSCLIAMALKNSETGRLRVSEIYNFMTKNYPYFKTAPNGWKNSVRHNLSLSQCFTKVDMPATKQRKGCLWTMNPDKIEKMDDEVFKWSQKDPIGIKRSMAKPEDFGVLEKFCVKHERQIEENQQDLIKPPIKAINYNRNIKHSVMETVDHQEMIIKDEYESEINLDNSLLDSTYHVDFWGELEEKLEFDIPLTGFPNTCNQMSNAEQNLAIKDNAMMLSGGVSFSQPSRSLKIKST